MDVPKPSSTAGARLKLLRERLGLTTRDVETRSRRLAQERGNQEYYMAHAWLTDIENGEFTPSIYKFYTLSAVYHRNFTELASYFGLRFGDLSRDWAMLPTPKTHLLAPSVNPDIPTVQLPVAFKPGAQLQSTHLLARIVEQWDHVPVAMLQHLDLRKSVYGYIGSKDYMLYPLIRPGSLVQIDPSQRKVVPRWETEFDRPIYFVELRDGYLCTWCQLDHGQLIAIPHPLSKQDVRRFDHPAQAEIIGRVTGIAMSIAGETTRDPIAGSGIQP
jgi:transcriptional regulator with XRE-family HTH domain/aromatic ring-cleaving dioxygenase